MTTAEDKRIATTEPPSYEDVLLDVWNLKKYFPVKRGIFQRTVAHVKAVDDISFWIRKGETLGLVGESGCGKTTAGRSLLRLLEPTHGAILFDPPPDVLERARTLRATLERRILSLDASTVSSLEGIAGMTARIGSRNGNENGSAPTKIKGEEHFSNLGSSLPVDLGWLLDHLGVGGRTSRKLENLLPSELVDIVMELQTVRDNYDIRRKSRKPMRALRRDLQIIFQDPYASLNPRMTIGSIVGEALTIHNLAKGKEKENRVKELLATVGLDPSHIRRYPHEFSGGQRQRIGVARALAVSPKLIVADEPVSALDVSIQAQVVNLLQDLQESMGLTFLFIAHDLSVVEHISNRVAVMYLGKIVEIADSALLYDNPLHPYTKALLSSVPIPDPTLREQKREQRITLEGDVPTPINPPSGCRFHPRCPIAEEICAVYEPELLDHGDGHFTACHFAEGRPTASGDDTENQREEVPA